MNGVNQRPPAEHRKEELEINENLFDPEALLFQNLLNCRYCDRTASDIIPQRYCGGDASTLDYCVGHILEHVDSQCLSQGLGYLLNSSSICFMVCSWFRDPCNLIGSLPTKNQAVLSKNHLTHNDHTKIYFVANGGVAT